MFKFALQGIWRENFPMFYCCKDYKNVTKDNKFLWSRFFVCFEGFVSSFPEIQETFQEWVLLTFRGRKVAS